MTTETRKRIRAYKKMLPELRERVIAVALLLAMSASMLGSASFAWITLSRSPEVSGMSTTVAANGNLEIALAQGSAEKAAKEPDESAVGDSSAAQGIVASNVTWGNLVNVSDPKYGLDHIELRPALLSGRGLLVTPLEGASYGEDGRVINTNDKYYYGSWKDFGNGEFRFASGDSSEYGVRAITSVIQENVGSDNLVQSYLDDAAADYKVAREIYNGMVTGTTKLRDKNGQQVNETCITALQDIVAVYAQDKINSMGSFAPPETAGQQKSISSELFYLYQILDLIKESLDAEAEALLHLANLQAYRHLMDTTGEGDKNTFMTMAELQQAYRSGEMGNRYGVTLHTLEKHLANYALVQSAMKDKICKGVDDEGNRVENSKSLEEIALECNDPGDPSIPTYYWTDVEDAIMPLVDIEKTTINGWNISELEDHVMDILGKTVPVVIGGGLLMDVESRYVDSDYRMNAKVGVKVKVKVPIGNGFVTSYTVNGVVTTKAGQDDTDGYDPDYWQDIDGSGGAITGGGSFVGKESYGLALDLWLRTNYPNAILTLEGAAEYTEVRATHKGYEVSVMTAEEMSFDAYQMDGKWYYVDGDGEIPADIVDVATTEPKYDRIVSGYHGENRVWEDWEQKLSDGLIDKDATTQGAGSCFVFYADTPTEQEKLLEMLDAFTVVFIDGNGESVATAKLNTANAYINVGKVTVPLEVYDSETKTEEEEYGIMQLQQNQPTRLTAVVYLNGKELQNENVLSAGELQGQLNIQFGTNAVLNAPENEELMSQYRTIIASVTVGDETIQNGIIDGDGNGLPYTAAGYNARVDLAITGEQPERIEGFFVREINATQGTRGDTVEFTKTTTTDADGNEVISWSANFSLKNPGTYVLNTLLVDGVQYNLHDGNGVASENNHPKVKIAGLELRSVSSSVASGTYMTTNTSMPVTVTAQIDTSLNLTSVQAQFFREGDSQQYNAILTRDVDNSWKGTVNINQSGQYVLRYVSVDGETTQTLDVPAASQTNLTLYLGVNAQVYTSVPENERVILLKNGESRQIPMLVRVYNDVPELMTDEILKQVKLYYNLNDSVLGGENKPLDMSWEESTDGSWWFKGYLNVTSDNTGTLSFNKLVISDKADGTGSALTNVSGCPTFEIANYNPPEWNGVVAAPERQLVIDGSNATASVNLTSATGGTVWARFSRTYKNDNGEYVTDNSIQLENPSSNGNTFTFALVDDSGNKEGLWKLQKVYAKKLINTGEVNEERTFLLYDASKSTESLETTVIQNVYPTVYYGDEEYTSTAQVPNMIELDDGGFLEEQTSDVVKVEVRDYTGELMPELSGATWSFTHITKKGDENIQLKYSGYTNEKGSPITESAWSVNMTLNTETIDGVAIPKSASMTESFTYGGEYVSAIMLKFTDGQTYALTEDEPVFAVKSSVPSVTVSSVYPTGSFDVDSTGQGGSGHKTLSDSDTAPGIYDADGNVVTNGTGTTAWVYYKCVKEKLYSTTYHTYINDDGYYNPQVTLKLSDIDNFTKATLSFGTADSSLYTQVSYSSGIRNGTWTTTSPAQYSWTKENESVKRFVGYCHCQKNRTWDVASANGQKTPVGTISASTLTVETSERTYLVTIPTVTINNPY